MTEITLIPEARTVRLTWPDGGRADYPFLWLRDNCPGAWHPQTEEKVLDLLEVCPDIAPAQADIDGDALRIGWAGTDHESRFPLEWLRAHRPGQPRQDPAEVARAAWRGNLGAGAIPRARAAEVLEDDGALARWLREAKATGLSIVEGLADDPEAGLAVARRVGFLRETNFGVTFEVRSKPDPNNLAYTADALPLHTDLPNQELPPGWQFLHCLRNDATGGGSVFADGLALSEDLRHRDPDAFEQLSTVAIPFRFHDTGCDIRRRQKVITLDDAGRFVEMCWNAHIADVLDLPPGMVKRYYRAYRAVMAMTRDPAYRIEVKLAPGQMVVFDNRRVLHGRAAFDPSTGARHLVGCYVDRGELDSRLRVLARGAA